MLRLQIAGCKYVMIYFVNLELAQDYFGISMTLMLLQQRVTYRWMLTFLNVPCFRSLSQMGGN